LAECARKEIKCTYDTLLAAGYEHSDILMLMADVPDRVYKSFSRAEVILGWERPEKALRAAIAEATSVS